MIQQKREEGPVPARLPGIEGIVARPDTAC